MSDKRYKVDEPIRVLYQGKGVNSGLTVNMKVFDETDTEDVGQTAAMTEIGSSGRYTAEFTPDAEGNWSVQVSDSAGGEAMLNYSVGTYNIQTIGATLASVDAKVDALESPPMIG